MKLKIFILSSFLMTANGNPTWEQEHDEEMMLCYGDPDLNLQYRTQRIWMVSKLQPSTDNVFFIQTSCTNDRPAGYADLSPEQACSIHSASIQNPSKKVILLYTCPLERDFLDSPSSGVVKTLLNLPNFHFAHKNLHAMYKEVLNELVPNATYPSITTDEVLRFLVVYKFGGTHINMDLINMRPLDDLGVNFIGAKSKMSVGNSMFNFEPKHEFLKEFIQRLYDPLGRNTADLLTTVLQRFCSLKDEHSFDEFQNFTECNLKVVPTFSSRAKDRLRNKEIKADVTPYFMRTRDLNYQADFQNETQELFNHCPRVDYTIEDNSSSTLPSNLWDLVTRNEYFVFKQLPSSSRSVFFLETSCSSTTSDISYHPVLSARQACAMFSAAFYNPSRDVILVHTCPGFINMSSELTNKLFDQPNFSLAEIDLMDFYSGRLCPKMVDDLKKSEFQINHNADVLRLILLYLYGGIYLDHDVMTLRSFDWLGTNYIGAESYKHVSNGVMNFEVRHEFIKECLKRAPHYYQPEVWNSVGPELMSNVLETHCEWYGNFQLELEQEEGRLTINDIQELFKRMPFRIDNEKCNLTVLPSSLFYAIPYEEYEKFYNSTEWPTVESLLKRSYVAHFWDHMGHPAELIEDQPYAKLAEQHCYPIYQAWNS